MLISYPSFLKDNTDFQRNTINGSIGYHMLPGKHPLLGGWGLGINAHSEHKEAALSFLQWTCKPTIANYSTLLGSNSAITRTYTNDELNNLYPWLPLYYSMYKYSRPTLPPALPDGTVLSQYDIDEIVCRHVLDMVHQKTNVQETLAATQEELKELLARR